MGPNLVEPRVDEEVNPRSREGGVDGTGGRYEVRGVRVGEEARDDAGLGDDLIVELYGGNEAALGYCWCAKWTGWT